MKTVTKLDRLLHFFLYRTKFYFSPQTSRKHQRNMRENNRKHELYLTSKDVSMIEERGMENW